ncbi:MAG: hypothetical protein U0975_16370 [Erythrobacter sp.]|nr:hypothetical protein [Erythrobacter sp.]MDZ4274237.1 hypothetical protein [Erythrobacter sp.]
MKVKAIQPHGNPHGKAFWKEAQTVYDLPEREALGLIAAGLVEAVPARKPRAGRKTSRGAAQHTD